jgi:hypothetical protein
LSGMAATDLRTHAIASMMEGHDANDPGARLI